MGTGARRSRGPTAAARRVGAASRACLRRRRSLRTRCSRRPANDTERCPSSNGWRRPETVPPNRLLFLYRLPGTKARLVHLCPRPRKQRGGFQATAHRSWSGGCLLPKRPALPRRLRHLLAASGFAAASREPKNKFPVFEQRSGCFEFFPYRVASILPAGKAAPAPTARRAGALQFEPG
jgi:hypothetical protein